MHHSEYTYTDEKVKSDSACERLLSTWKKDIDSLDRLSGLCHSLSARAGWWTDMETGEPLERNRGELMMLIVSELSEAFEGARKDMMDDHLPHRKMEEVELADTLIRIFDHCGADSFSVSDAVKLILVVVSELSTIGSDHTKEEKTLRIAASVVMILDYCRKFGFDVSGALEEKLIYNMKRPDHKPENRKKSGGKAF